MRLPQRYMPQFLRNLRQDYIDKSPYLKYLRISSKFIQVCDCSWKNCHSYCVTAYVLRTQKIYCVDCDAFFQLYVKDERLFTG